MRTYYFREKLIKITDKYPILDEDKDPVFYVEQNFRLVGFKERVYDLNKTEIITIKRKLVSIFPTYNIEFANGEEMMVKANLSLIKRSVDAVIKGGKLKVKGSIFDHEFKVEFDNELVGEVSKKFFSLRDSYTLKVYDEKYTLHLIALCLCLNNMQDIDEKKEEDD
ncbi:LURP-one-related family protein [Anaerococcus sp. AGMB09787]|uniref:LURP-one-related/scramblase family protein n=1 Tax=Anaerococcus sp. AGMB09787 TaxID=2922869 RepID=UPI001FAEE445|nr:LURP-one-related family protein [Anaerococcus sp. AGMB09787]